MACNNTTILLVDDDREVRAFLADNLTADGYEVLEADTLVAAKRLLGTRFLDLAIIEPGLPDGDGLELLSLVRGADGLFSRIDPDLPLIVLSRRSTEVERLRCFARGCDDFLGRPYSYFELRARIEALLRRRSRATLASRVRVGPLEVDSLSRQAWLWGTPLKLSSKEFSLLRILASDPGRVFRREELLELVWGWTEPTSQRTTRTLDSHASRLRRKLSCEDVQFVVNVWGVGYRLTDPSAESASVRPPGRAVLA